MEKSEKVEAYYAEEHHFKEGIAKLREVALKTKAEETFKWHAPVYMVNGKNVFWISRFKNHYGLGFFNGSSSKDPKGVLVNAQPGKTQAMRHWRFKSNSEIDKKNVLQYLNEALENQEKEMG